MLLFGIVLTLGLNTCPGFAEQTTAPSAKMLTSIRDNAMDAKHNAHIAQWQRVNREVDRIVASTRKLSAVLPETPGFADLQQAVQELRVARTRHDDKRIQEASDHLIQAAGSLLQTSA